MPENVQPETMATWMRDVERRLRAVESRKVLIGTPIVLRSVVPSSGTVVGSDVVVDSITAVNTHQLVIPYVAQMGVRLRIPVIVTGGNASLYVGGPPGVTDTTDTVSIPAGAQTVAIDWDISGWATTGSYGVLLYILVSAASGGSVLVGNPFTAINVDAEFTAAAANGNPRVL